MECTIYTHVRRVGISSSLIKKAVTYVLKKEKKDGAVSVHFIGDVRMRTLNRTHRGKDKTTDVLSFAAQEGDMFFETDEIGDIFISVPQIRRQARTWEVSYKEELLRMLIHGILHAMGYDHEKEADARIMFPKQERYLTHIKTL